MVSPDDAFFYLVRLAIGTRSVEDGVNFFKDQPEEEQRELWKGIFELAVKQSLAGIVFHALNKLPMECLPPKDIRRQWMVIGEALRKRNQLIYRQSALVSEKFLSEGFRSCILKGQGNALLYPNMYIRQPGDIDIWLDGERWDIFNYVRKFFPEAPFKCQHIEFPVLQETEVEVHFYPSYTMNVVAGRHLKKFFKEERERQFTNKVELPDGLGHICMPTPYFNAVYQLTHINLHFLIEGIGLRQFLDYFFVLKALDKSDHKRVAEQLDKINLLGFARAVLYVVKEIFNAPDDMLYATPDEKKGADLLNEILICGNFGRYDTRYWKKDGGFWDKQLQKFHRNFRFLSSYPSEELNEPIFRLGHFIWRQYYQLRYILSKK